MVQLLVLHIMCLFLLSFELVIAVYLLNFDHLTFWPYALLSIYSRSIESDPSIKIFVIVLPLLHYHGSHLKLALNLGSASGL